MGKSGRDRREFIANGLLLAGAAGLARSAIAPGPRPDGAAADPPVGSLRRFLHL